MAVENIALKIVGEHTMHCGGCARTVIMVLKSVPGVLTVNADHRTQLVDVALNPAEAHTNALKDRLGQLGYEAVSVESASL
jgi:copper chaperone CopZ